MKVNPNIFFKFHEGKFIVWNYRAHEQFELTLPYVQRLYELGTRSSPEIEGAGRAPATQASPVQPLPAQIDQELADADLVSSSYPTAHWGWDSLAHIFHFGTSSHLPAGDVLPREDSSAAYIEQCPLIAR